MDQLKQIALEAYDDAFQYAKSIVSGERPACKNVILACQRFFNDLERCETEPDVIRWNKDRALKALAFFSSLPHVKGEWSGKRIHLMPFHSFIITNVYGFELNRTKGWGRRFRKAHISVPRKSAKSTIAAGFALYEMLNEQGAEVYSASRTRDMAKICWADASEMINKSPILKQYFKANKSIIRQNGDNSLYRPLSSDTNVLDGLNTQCAILDELHLLPTDELYGVLETSMSARREPLLLSITTAGFNLNGFCYSLEKEYLEKLLQGTVKNDSFFALMYGIDEGDDWKDEATWYKANPALGISKDIDDLREIFARAQEQKEAKVQFLTKHLNVWVTGSETWIDLDKWLQCPESLPDEELRDLPCYIGVDLARTYDFTAVVAAFKLPDGSFDIRPYSFLPEASLTLGSNTHQKILAKFHQDGSLITTAGEIMNADHITEFIQDLCSKYNVKEIVFDNFGATTIQHRLFEKGLPVVTVSQSTKTFSEPMKEVEGAIIAKAIRNPNNSCFTWMMSNVCLKNDEHKNCYPAKASAESKIDGPVALFMSVHRALLNKETDITGFLSNPVVF